MASWMAATTAWAQSGGTEPVPVLTPDVVACYTALLTALGVLALFTLSVRQTTWTAYAVLFAFYVVGQFFNEQKLRGIVWQDDVSDMRRLFFGAALFSTLCFILAWKATNPKHGLAWVRPWLLISAAACPVFWVVGTLLPVNAALAISVIMLMVSMGIHLIPLRTLETPYGQSFRSHIVFADVVTAMSFTAYFLLLIAFPPRELPATALIVTNRILMSFLVALGGIMSIHTVVSLHNDRERVLREALSAAEKEAETNRALLKAERNYARVRDVARKQRERLAEASHDIKQPIASLRAHIDSLANEQAPELQAQLGQAFDYLEQLADSYGAGSGHGARSAAAGETIPASLLFQTLDRMFRSEAETKGLAFSVDAAEANIRGDPLALMRILSNLVTNAIMHTEKGVVRITARRDSATVVIEVFSSSPPIPDNDVERVFQPNEKGDHSDGRGLGLAIVRRLAENANLALQLRTIPGQGNSFSVSVPLAD